MVCQVTWLTVVQRDKWLQGRQNAGCKWELNEEKSPCDTVRMSRVMRLHCRCDKARALTTKARSRWAALQIVLDRLRSIPYRRPSRSGMRYGKAPTTFMKKSKTSRLNSVDTPPGTMLLLVYGLPCPVRPNLPLLPVPLQFSFFSH